jgi:hypothetical protein
MTRRSLFRTGATRREDDGFLFAFRRWRPAFGAHRDLLRCERCGGGAGGSMDELGGLGWHRGGDGAALCPDCSRRESR